MINFRVMFLDIPIELISNISLNLHEFISNVDIIIELLIDFSLLNFPVGGRLQYFKILIHRYDIMSTFGHMKISNFLDFYIPKEQLTSL